MHHGKQWYMEETTMELEETDDLSRSSWPSSRKTMVYLVDTTMELEGKTMETHVICMTQPWSPKTMIKLPILNPILSPISIFMYEYGRNLTKKELTS